MAEMLQEVATLIAAGSTAEAGSTTWPVYGGGFYDVEGTLDRQVALIRGPGLPDLGGTSSGRAEVERPTLQVLVRGLKQNEASSAYEDAAELAVAVKNALHGHVGVSSSGGTHYVGIWHQNGPAWLGADESGRPVFSMNFRVERSKT